MRTKPFIIIGLIIILIAGALIWRHEVQGPSEDQLETEVRNNEICGQASGSPCASTSTPASGTDFSPVFEDGTVPQASSTNDSANASTSASAGNPAGDGVACTMEAKLCPDGSYVGRSGPKCEFAACPGMQ